LIGLPIVFEVGMALRLPPTCRYHDWRTLYPMQGASHSPSGFGQDMDICRVGHFDHAAYEKTALITIAQA